MMFYKKDEVCPLCNQTKPFTYRHIKTPVKVHDVCEACLSEQNEKNKFIEKDQEKNERLNAKLTLRRIHVHYTHDIDEHTGIPKLMNDKAINQTIKGFFSNIVHRNKGFYLYGIPGSGKTTLMQLFAYQLLLKPAKNGLVKFSECLFATEANMVSNIFLIAKEDFDWNFQLAVNHVLKDRRFIFIDEMGARKMRDKELEIVDLLFHYFEENKHRLFIFATSNRSIEQLKDFYLREETSYKDASQSDVSGRITSRLYGLVIPVSSEKKDYRLG